MPGEICKAEDGAHRSRAAAGASPGDLATLLTLFSPAFPIGGFAYSHGLETAVRECRVKRARDVERWVEVLMSRGSGWNDLVFVALAHGAVTTGDDAALADLAELASALSGSAERRAETVGLGSAFLTAARPWIAAAGHRLAVLEEIDAMPMPVAAGAVAALAGLGKGDTLTAHAQNFAHSLVSAAVRLVPLGQGEWVGVIHALAPAIVGNAGRARTATLDDLGSSALVSEIAAMRHETLPTRLFRS
ncbi:urease accessory protein UreF [Jiella avicenniae]|uniref:Urease accessory protein UreF n=1 Tax=Jiella avicenniae TaxID=2907202 RepID=A0A9X1T4L6_9HYPH|nr:urease accessory UreF family protein [Jiella avicenniae]MCE7027879.1 urease accessory protein UreF [Jiella avicenniae]